ncbi:unnamed protein product [Oncorhynchus mykiss]|uniref:Myb/SANT-like DNA-binding domain-containing protein n=1 Tax=Oncorhynchus mykiss TaxID=8022 RepID=A0A060XRP0_ONCMY|nr:unnamed protein product [Oncorhynchus mykiss]
MNAYAEYEFIFILKSNTVAAAKERELAWQKIADRVNACNPTGTKRTWQQLKMKCKNILPTAMLEFTMRKRGGPSTSTAQLTSSVRCCSALAHYLE